MNRNRVEIPATTSIRKNLRKRSSVTRTIITPRAVRTVPGPHRRFGYNRPTFTARPRPGPGGSHGRPDGLPSPESRAPRRHPPGDAPEVPRALAPAAPLPSLPVRFCPGRTTVKRTAAVASLVLGVSLLRERGSRAQRRPGPVERLDQRATAGADRGGDRVRQGAVRSDARARGRVEPAHRPGRRHRQGHEGEPDARRSGGGGSEGREGAGAPGAGGQELHRAQRGSRPHRHELDVALARDRGRHQRHVHDRAQAHGRVPGLLLHPEPGVGLRAHRRSTTRSCSRRSGSG